jgi:hypothetical protein
MYDAGKMTAETKRTATGVTIPAIRTVVRKPDLSHAQFLRHSWHALRREKSRRQQDTDHGKCHNAKHPERGPLLHLYRISDLRILTRTCLRFVLAERL